MKESWLYKRLGEVASFINGYAFKPEQWTSSGTPIVRIQNLNNPDAPFNYYDGEVPDKVKIKDGDLLISWSASLGAYIWQGGDAFLNQHIFKVEFDKLDIDKIYLKYAVISKLNMMAGLVHGATMKHIVKKDFDNTCIPYPPINEQKDIVSELDKINELISLKKEQLKDYDNLAQSIFFDMFGDPVENEKGWIVKSIEEICSSIVRGPFGSALKKEFFVKPDSTTYKIYEQKHAIQKDATIGSYYVTEDKFKELSRFEVKPNDIIMSCSGTIGELYRIPSTAEKGLMNQALLKFTLSEDIHYQYFLYLMEYIKKDFTVRGTGLQNIGSVKIIKKMSFGLPPLSLQQEFANRIEAIEKQKNHLNTTLKDLETLLASRMQHWFE